MSECSGETGLPEWNKCPQSWAEHLHALRTTIIRNVPEWQVFVRHADGRGQHFTVSRRLQFSVLGGVAGLALWALAASIGAIHHPQELAEKERQLDLALNTYRDARQHLGETEQKVADITREVDQVHASLLALAQSQANLTPDKSAIKSARLARAVGDDGSGGEAKPVMNRVRELEESLDRLKDTYAGMVQKGVETAQNRISDTERQLSRLGLSPARVLADKVGDGRGGPYLPPHALQDDTAPLSTLVERVQAWAGMKNALQRLPLGEPLRDDYELTSTFGVRNDPLNNRTGIHEGIDLAAPVGTPVYATGEGVVTFAEPWDRYGNTVELDHGHDLTSRYAHLSRILVKPGQRVTRATILGMVGSTGRSTGPHLHYEVRLSDDPKDPIKFIAAGRNVQKTR